LLADLRELRIDAANLPTLEPSRDLWSAIAARIETPVVEIMPGRGAVAPSGGTVERGNGGTEKQRGRLAPMWMGLAAAGLVAITAGVTYQLTKSTVDVRSLNQVASTAPTAPAVVVAAPTSPVRVDSAVAPLNRSSAQPGLALASAKPG